MKILRSHNDVSESLKGLVLAIGNFDGVHRGHQAVLSVAKERAAEAGVPAGVMVFEPHPRTFFQPDVPLFRLTSLERKCELLQAFGLDVTVALTFDTSLANLTAHDFVKNVLVDAFEVSHVITGYDFFFGKGRKGNPDVMKSLGDEYGFDVTVVSPVGESKSVFSSSKIRDLLRSGDVRTAADMLGYWWCISGKVEGGAKRGAELGFPTANVRLEKGQDLKHGIYAARIYVGKDRYQGAAYLGTRPTFDDGAAVLETFIFDFEEDLYDRSIVVELIAFLRDDMKFDTPEALKAQIDADCAQAKEMLVAIEAQDPMAHFPLANYTAT